MSPTLTRRRLIGGAGVAAAASAVGVPAAAVAGRVAPAPDFEDLVVDVGDALLSVRQIGRGEPIVIHPSLARGARDFDPLAKLLAAGGYRVISFDPRGIGQSWAPPAALDKRTLHDYAKDMRTVMRRLGVRKAHVAGHAYGNRVARTVATDFPELTATVLLFACGGGIPIAKVTEGLTKLTTPETTAAEVRVLTKEIFFSRRSDPRPWYVGWYASAGAAERISVGLTDFAPIEGGGKGPMLIVQGKDDIVAPPSIGRDLRRKYGDRITLFDLADAGHAMVTEKPAAVAKAVLAYLARHPIR